MTDLDLDPLWDDLDWAIGQMLLMGWDGTEVTPQIRFLIEDHHLGSIILTTKNMKSAAHTARLVQELQAIAHRAGHPYPLLIAMDQENGGVNSLFDLDFICQFPSAMGVAATGSLELAREVAEATATQVSACGVNLILGPVLDVLTNARYQPLGVRATGDDPQEVVRYSLAAMEGFRAGGVATCGKHFPSYGNLDFRGSSLDVPVITQTLEELSLSALVPFRAAIRSGKLDAMFVGGCAMANPDFSAPHACLSDRVVDELLRNELGFDGVAISECLEMEALSHEIGVKAGTVMAVQAGCDVVMLCRAFDVQLEAISGLRLGVENGIIERERVITSLRRVLALKKSCTSWDKALNPPGVSLLSRVHPSHLELSKRAYEGSITVVRDRDGLLPLSRSLHPREEVLLLTPLVKPLPASAATRKPGSNGSASRGGGAKRSQHLPPHQQVCWPHEQESRGTIMSGEGVFRELGISLARVRNGKVLHTSYTANGLRPVHENLINRASCIIIVTADANRNLYQAGFTKHVATMCAMARQSQPQKKKALVVVAVSSPYDFAVADAKTIGTYVCTYDFTETAMYALVRALFGDFVPRGTLPGTLRKKKTALGSSRSRQQWLVERYDARRDAKALEALLHSLAPPVQSAASEPDDSVAASVVGGPRYLAAARASAFDLPQPPKHQDGTSESTAMVVEDAPELDADAAEAPRVEQAHFVVRNSSTGALYGFCATYFFVESGTGVVGALFVDPEKRNVSIGASLHRAAMRSLGQRHGSGLGGSGLLKRVQLGCAFPGVFPGVPVVSVDESAGASEGTGKGKGRAGDGSSTGPSTSGSTDRTLASWFANTAGWDPSSRVHAVSDISTLAIPRLASWTAPTKVVSAVKTAGIARFDLVHGLQSQPGPAQEVLAHVSTAAADIDAMGENFTGDTGCIGPEILELYRHALQLGDNAESGVGYDSAASTTAADMSVLSATPPPCGVIRALDASGALLGTVIVCLPGRPDALAAKVPCLLGTSPASALGAGARGSIVGARDEKVGGILAPVVMSSGSATQALVLQGLTLLGTSQVKQLGASRVVFALALDCMREPLEAMGFQVTEVFERFTSSYENWADLL